MVINKSGHFLLWYFFSSISFPFFFMKFVLFFPLFFFVAPSLSINSHPRSLLSQTEAICGTFTSPDCCIRAVLSTMLDRHQFLLRCSGLPLSLLPSGCLATLQHHQHVSFTCCCWRWCGACRCCPSPPSTELTSPSRLHLDQSPSPPFCVEETHPLCVLSCTEGQVGPHHHLWHSSIRQAAPEKLSSSSLVGLKLQLLGSICIISEGFSPPSWCLPSPVRLSFLFQSPPSPLPALVAAAWSDRGCAAWKRLHSLLRPALAQVGFLLNSELLRLEL